MANFNFNQVILGGRLTADPELKQTQSGTPVCSFSIAVSRRFAANETDFFDCVAWRDRAEFLCKYFRKGSSVCVVGTLQKRSWNDNKSNQKRYATEVIVDEVNFVDSKDDADGGEYQPNYTNASPANFEDVNGDDDLPF